MSWSDDDRIRLIGRAANEIDLALIDVERRLDWLMQLSPTNNDDRWQAFVESGYREIPPLTYPVKMTGLRAMAQELAALPILDVEDPAIEALLAEKAHELSRFVTLIDLRETAGFPTASIALFGGTGPRLLSMAEKIIDEVPLSPSQPQDCDCYMLEAAARDMFERFRELAPDFSAEIHVVDDLNSMLMVNMGDLYIARSTKVPKDRVAPLIAHEVGVHVLTRYNGRQQPLRQFEYGLAHYDALQEGLGCFAEFLAGNLPADRLRVLAARVLAAEWAVEGQTAEEIYARLHEEFQLSEHDAFDTTVRAKRGGGLTKDAVYLRGLWELLEYLEHGGDFDFLFLGKISLQQRELVQRMLADEMLVPPVLKPPFAEGEDNRTRIEQVRRVPIEHLYQLKA